MLSSCLRYVVSGTSAPLRQVLVAFYFYFFTLNKVLYLTIAFSTSMARAITSSLHHNIIYVIIFFAMASLPYAPTWLVKEQLDFHDFPNHYHNNIKTLLNLRVRVPDFRPSSARVVKTCNALVFQKLDLMLYVIRYYIKIQKLLGQLTTSL